MLLDESITTTNQKQQAIKTKIVRSKCMADMFVWLGFEYMKTDDGYVFTRSWSFDLAWEDAHALRDSCQRRFRLENR